MNELSDRSTELPEAHDAPDVSAPGGAQPAADVNPNPGDRNQNPAGISFFQLIAEDFRTHESNLFVPGFWAVAIHRFGNLRMDIRPRLLPSEYSRPDYSQRNHQCRYSSHRRSSLLWLINKEITPWRFPTHLTQIVERTGATQSVAPERIFY